MVEVFSMRATSKIIFSASRSFSRAARVSARRAVTSGAGAMRSATYDYCGGGGVVVHNVHPTCCKHMTKKEVEHISKRGEKHTFREK